MTGTPTRTEGTLAGVGGMRLHWQQWTPPSPRGSVVLVHGMGEHIGRYDEVVAALTEHALVVTAADHRGHGRSDGRRAYIDRMDNLVADLGTVVDLAASAHPGLPLFLLGHSLGGLVATLYAVDHQDRLAGLVLSGPLAALEAANPVTRAVARVLSATAPTLPLVGVDSDQLSHDPAVGPDYRDDPLVYSGKLPARTVGELAAGVSEVQARASTLTIPLLVLHGRQDAIVPPVGSAELHAKARSSDKRRIVYDGMYHEIFNEVDRSRVFADVTDWLDAHLGKATAGEQGVS
ncbi:alpha/beta hydrolase [Rhodococcus sp. D2-41]|uniref:alpha/beta hydrolase n=1 Tax=Speluncibacter jeojiensis TaxID=2710754 RepID=UPI00240FABB5|nr:alpha/beta hydrolase [Rhodococcus sp. D2-41]MDG3008669.1 alpha/beta hydrolase [Rhodococcus sp. D2-41]